MNMWIFLIAALVVIIFIMAAENFKYKIEKEETEDYLGSPLIIYVIYRKNIFSKWKSFRSFRSIDDAVTYLEKKTKQPY